MDEPATLEINTGSLLSMKRSTLLLPVIWVTAIEAEVPSKVNATPVLGQLNSLVAGLTRPR
jgi:hypothetical protein